MILQVKQKFVTEDIIDENGNKLGEIKFNPNDARIMGKLSKIINYLSDNLRELKKLGDMPTISQEKLTTLEDFEQVEDDINKLCKGIDIETNSIDNVFKDLSEVFGKETIDIFTGGTMDIDALMPLIEYVMPYVKEARTKKVNKYLNNKKEDVLE